jgi:hypothetical protein
MERGKVLFTVMTTTGVDSRVMYWNIPYRFRYYRNTPPFPPFQKPALPIYAYISLVGSKIGKLFSLTLPLPFLFNKGESLY